MNELNLIEALRQVETIEESPPVRYIRQPKTDVAVRLRVLCRLQGINNPNDLIDHLINKTYLSVLGAMNNEKR